MADWTLDLIERNDGKYIFTLTENLVPPVVHSPQRSYINREAAILAAEDMRDTIIGGETRTTTSFDFDPV